jgi:hypothetical protein
MGLGMLCFVWHQINSSGRKAVTIAIHNQKQIDLAVLRTSSNEIEVSDCGTAIGQENG